MKSQPEGSLRDEIRQTRPFDSRGQEAVLGILKTADEIRWRLGQLMKPAGLSLEQYNILRILRGAGENGLPTLEVAERMIERSPAITRLLDKLEKKGFIRRLRCTKDRRLVYCVIMDDGLAALDSLEGNLAAESARFEKGIEEREFESVIQTLDRLRANLR